MKKLVGRYQLGYRPVSLYAVPGDINGSVKLAGETGTTEIYVGVDDQWPETLSTLLHEVYECVLIDLNTRFKKQPSFSFDTSDYTFFMTHNELSEAHERVAYFLSEAVGPFEKMYEKLSRKKFKK